MVTGIDKSVAQEGKANAGAEIILPAGRRDILEWIRRADVAV